LHKDAKWLILAVMTPPRLPDWPTLRRKAAWFAMVIAIWLAVSFIISLQNYVSSRVNGTPQPWIQAFATTVPWYFAWALLTPVVVWLADRFDFNSRAIGRFVAVHLPAGIAVAVGHALIYVAMASVINRDNPHFPDVGDLIAIKLSGSIHINLMTYSLIVGLVIAGRAYGRLRDREVTAVRLEAQLAEAETAALRAQLQPHFLFNTLNAISALVPEDPVRANRLIARLGDLLRLSIDGRGQVCTLAEELDFTDAYLAIEQERLGDRLTIVRRIDPEALTAKVPALLLQPLAENAVRHGLASRVRGGTLTLSAEHTASHVRLTVSDDGRGAIEVRDGIGLGNTRRRLQQLYGKNQQLIITTAPDAGFRVVIEVPR
jgi:two-component system, LytTR family, sensor kinase